MKITLEEQLHQHYAQKFHIQKLLYEQKTEHQHLVIFENTIYGRVMALDGIIQTTERDEFIYHEMFAHVPLFAHPNPKKVLIIGGGDGGLLREVLRHPSVEQATLVEIDSSIIQISQKFLPKHSQGAFHHPKTEIIIDNGLHFAEKTDRLFDVILCDSTDPIGPGADLFGKKFYQYMQNILNPGGIFVAQNGVSLLQEEEGYQTRSILKTLFPFQGHYHATVPSYIGGNMQLAWASTQIDLKHPDQLTLESKVNKLALPLRYYNLGMHQAAFQLPEYLTAGLQNYLKKHPQPQGKSHANHLN
jgi:spermidine synthase